MKTEILFILDRSTSMGDVAEQAVESFNVFLKKQQKKPKGKRLTLLEFDSRLEYIYQSKKIKNCDPLILGKTYKIQGCTALLDAIGTGLHKIRKAKHAIVAIYTDGYENQSMEWDTEQVKAALAKAEKKGYEVIFLAADIDTSYATQVLGMRTSKVATVNKAKLSRTMDIISNYTTAYISDGLATSANLQDDVNKEEATS